MHTIADTKMLVEEGVISNAAARIIEARARNTMVALAINTLLCAGILFATFGLIFWLADAFAVAVFGLLMAGAGLAMLSFGKPLYAMFGNAAALIGSGMLLGGMGIELSNKYPDSAGWVMIATESATTKDSPSFLGEVWYGEAESPQGPWKKAVRIVTHDKQTFYNPCHHAFFDEDGGRVIYFEGTYCNTFTDSPPTPRYNYNQVMYRLDLAHPALREAFPDNR